MTPIDQRLIDFADMLGVTIEYTELSSDRDGEYEHDTRRIRLRPGMSARHHRSVLAHELAHAVFADVPSRFGPVNAKQERRADEWAALCLIDSDDYQHLEAIHGGHPGAIAVDLGVMRSIVIAYQRLLRRLGDITYTDPKMGRDQWALRHYVA